MDFIVVTEIFPKPFKNSEIQIETAELQFNGYEIILGTRLKNM